MPRGEFCAYIDQQRIGKRLSLRDENVDSLKHAKDVSDAVLF
jgi:hypothetical protein